MVVAAMVGRMVHGNSANDILNMFKNGTNCTKDLHISNKSYTFACCFSYLNWIYVDVDTPRSDCAGCFVVRLA